jgi:hypothetical protein
MKACTTATESKAASWAWIDDVWTPDGWEPCKGDSAYRYSTVSQITEAQVPKFRESRLAAFPRDIENATSATIPAPPIWQSTCTM